MSPRLKYFLIFLAIVLATYLSTKLWNLPPYGSPLNAVFAVFTVLLGITALGVLVKVFDPGRHTIDIFIDFIIGIWH